MVLIEKSRLWRRQLERKIALEAAARLLPGAAVVVIALAWLDVLISLPQGLRWALLALACVAGAAAFHRLWLAPRKSAGWADVFETAARCFPATASVLRPAWELARGGPLPHTSEALRREHLARAETLARSLPDENIFPWKPSSSARGWAVAGALAVASLPWLGFSPSWKRILAPWKDVPLEAYVQVKPGDAALEQGKPAEISALWAPGSPVGRDRRALKLWLRGTGGWRTAEWDKVEANGAGYVAEELTAPLEYRLTWRDLHSRPYRVVPVLAPELESVQAKVQGPDPVLSDMSVGEPLTVMRGSWVTFSGRPNQPLSRAILRLSSSPAPLAMKPAVDGRYEASVLVQEDAVLSFELEAADGRRNAAPVSYQIKAAPDWPPEIELLSPQAPVQTSPADALPITFSARDDGGLTKVALLVRGKGGEKGELALQRFEGKREFLGDYSWDLSSLAPGRYEFQLKAYDNARPPQTALSKPGSLEVVDFETAHARAEDSWRRAEEALKGVSEKEERASAAAAARSSAALEPELSALPQAWKDAAEAFSGLSRSLQDDAYANPGVVEQSQQLAAGLAKAASQEVPAAARSARAGDWAAAQKELAALGRRLERARQLLSEGRKVQGLQDFYTRAGRMSQAGSALEAELESVSRSAAAGAAVSGEQKRRLAAALQKLREQMDALQKAVASLPKAEPKSREEASRRAYALPLAEARDSADALAKALQDGDYGEAARLAQELSQQLAQIEKGIGQAASDAASGGSSQQGSAAAARAQQNWGEVVEEQTAVLERTQKLEQERLEGKLAAQKKLLEELARRQAALVSSAAAAGAAFPSDVLASMRLVQSQLERRKVQDAPERLRAISGRLRAESVKRESYANEEEEIARRLDAEPPGPSAGAGGAESAEAARAQGQVRAKTGRLKSELEALEDEVGSLPEGTSESLDGAMSEQAAAEAALAGGDSAGAVKHEESALEKLTQGGQGMSAAAGRQQSVQAGMGRPFSRGASSIRVMPSGGGRLGGQTGFVPLPSARDYRPPKELREELQRSLQETRPASYDGVIKEYFKRIAQ